MAYKIFWRQKGGAWEEAKQIIRGENGAPEYKELTFETEEEATNYALVIHEDWGEEYETKAEKI